MKIALVNTASLFVRGGAEILVDDLAEQLNARGHETVLFRVPFPNDYGKPLTELVLACRMLDFSSYDRVIAFKFPAYCVCHPQKSLWMFHQFRQVYDLFGKPDGVKITNETKALRDMISRIDNEGIGKAAKVFVNAQEVKNRLMHYNQIPSEVLMPPLKHAELYHGGEYGNYFYYPSRVTALKRQHLAIEAMKYTKTDVRLVIAGKATEHEYNERLKTLIKENGLQKKVDYKSLWVSDEEKIEMIAGSLGLIYIPYLEDSCGFVTYEGFYARKSVLSCTDSGGTSEFITNNRNGFLVSPTPQALAVKMDELYLNRKKAKSMGENAYESILQKNITWDETIRRLVE